MTETSNKSNNLNRILLLGDPRLHEISEQVLETETNYIKEIIDILHNLLLEFRNHYGIGRAIAAPQIGVLKRLIYLYLDKPLVLINPILKETSEEMIEVWDDCLCFPDLLVRVKRHKKCTISYYDLSWTEHTWKLENDQSELIQHEYDHLDGILATQRAIDSKSFKWRT